MQFLDATGLKAFWAKINKTFIGVSERNGTVNASYGGKHTIVTTTNSGTIDITPIFKKMKAGDVLDVMDIGSVPNVTLICLEGSTGYINIPTESKYNQKSYNFGYFVRCIKYNGNLYVIKIS